MKTNNFWMIHMHLVRKGELAIASWLLRKVIEGNKPAIIYHGLSCDPAWFVSGITKGNGYSIKLTY
ncbi:hypothetical protein [Dysgonomonas termitidis]|uniref:Uncharacterized protein n=1 Tax=Dysgonomonas termitidis TaxID=1516126 RepID=A0ABV9KVI0_9BACT